MKKRVYDKLPPVGVVVDIVIDTISVNWFLVRDEEEPDSEIRADDPELRQIRFPSEQTRTTLAFKVQFLEKYLHEANDYLDPSLSHRVKQGGSRQRRKQAAYQKLADSLSDWGMTINARTICTVQWQDGTITENIPSIDLVGYDSSGVVEFYPQSIVSVNPSELDNPDEKPWGVILKTDMENQITTVKWMSNGKELYDTPCIEDISVYSLIEHPEFEDILPQKLVVLKDKIEELPESIGEVITVKDGICSVFWITGEITEVYVSELKSIDAIEEEDNDADDDEEDEEDDDYYYSDEEEILEELEKLEVGEDDNENFENPNCGIYAPLLNYLPFDIATDIPESHKFFDASDSDLNPRTIRAIMRDWNLLKKNLPAGIFVRVSESKIDLLQVLIIGPRNTPYREYIDCIMTIYLSNLGYR